MKKIDYSEFTKSMTMLFVNQEIDEKYKKLRAAKVHDIITKMSGIGTREGLEQYIRNNNDALGDILVILGISEEYFKRVTSTLRIWKGMVFTTEWSLSATRKFMLEDRDMMDLICRLFLEGPNNDLFAKLIPSYRLDHFLIDNKVMCRLNNEDFIDFLVGKDFDNKYNNDQSNNNIHKLESIINDICDLYDFELVRNHNVDPIGNGTRDINVNYEIVKRDRKLLSYYIKYSFSITTSNTQSIFKRSVKDLRDYIKNKNPESKQIVIIDGAGWMGRQADLKDVWDYSDYCINLNHFDDLKEIIK